jgi:LPS sulfotransferase NodH
MHAGKSVIFCATQRTGSTLVLDDFLNVVGCQRANGEFLYRRIIEEETQRPWPEVWEEVSKKFSFHGYFFGKFMFHYTPCISSFIERNSIDGVGRCLKFVPELFDSFYNFFSDAIWVYIDRRDVFAQAVSIYLAEATNQWERLACEPEESGVPAVWEIRTGRPHPSDVPTSAVGYEYEKLKGYLQDFLAEREQWQHFFRHYRITPIRISYEEAVCGYPHYLKELLDKTGLTMAEAPPPRRMLKVGDQRNEEFAELLRKDFSLELNSRAHAGS